MTRFLHIDPAAQEVVTVEVDNLYDVTPDIKAGATDHGVVAPGIGIVVWEYGLVDGEGPYFVLNRQLYAGDAVLYGFNEAGETIDMLDPDGRINPLWLANKHEVELAIMAGVVERPQTSVNGAVLWRWS
jgi:hypothetical protein